MRAWITIITLGFSLRALTLGPCESVQHSLSSSDSLSKIAFWPSVEVSYRFQPKQSFPSITEWWSSDIWPVDSLWEQDGLHESVVGISKGERHSFFIHLKWDFEEAIFGDKYKDFIQIIRVRSEQKRAQWAMLEDINTKWKQHISVEKATTLEGKISQLAKELELRARFSYHCETNDAI